MKKVIDDDKNKLLETFHPEDGETKKEKYESLGKWVNVNFDLDGNLILWN